MTAVLISQKAPVAPAQAPVRDWYAQVVVPDCDATDENCLLDGTVEVYLGRLPVSAGEVRLAEALAWLGVEDTGCWISCVYHLDDDIEGIYFEQF